MKASEEWEARAQKTWSKACQEGKNYKVNVSGCKQDKNNSAKVGGIG